MARKAIAILALVIAGCTTAPVKNNPEMADRFEMMYTPEVKLVLLPDQCDKSNVAMGWLAYAGQVSTKDKAEGCWRHLDDDKIQIYLDAGNKQYLDYVLYKDKFNAVFEEQK